MYESLATERRDHMNLDYLRNVQMEASARRIQRAWKNYKTKCLIRSYSAFKVKKKSLLEIRSIASTPPNKGFFGKKKKTENVLNRC